MEEVGRFADISTPSTVKTSGAASDIERLCLKLKIPEPQHYKEKEENKEEEQEEVVLPFACPLCDKSFNSGKALGGHKRIHNQQPTTTTFTSNIYSSNGSIGNFNDKATKDQTGSRSGANNCPMCLKIFPSKISLFGHMRSHPERSWRGIEPPATGSPPLLLLPKPTCTSTSSTDHDHDHQVLDHDDHDRIVIDLAAAPPLVNWGVTAKRGRKSLTRSATSISPAAASPITTASASHDDSDSSARSASEDRMKKAALDLMALARASPAATNYNNRPAPPKDHKNIIFKKRKFAEYSDCHSSQNNGIQVRMQKPKLVTKASSASGPCKHVCSVCERSFPCYQALGGHMSIHKKAAPATAPAPAPAPAPRLVNIDLNQPPPPHDDDVDDH
ncbi:TFIIH C1-like domain containing protein [Parasponia andersonii]|uniref:TFIIH C1-like domain containing protein n=1 Tax=Parasponia andersonii TaxID=3476 RepID=A0A2P5AZ38_PARAD|nr:TFIIH C1-like domain containing protein [Parasponia andersonii]